MQWHTITRFLCPYKKTFKRLCGIIITEWHCYYSVIINNYPPHQSGGCLAARRRWKGWGCRLWGRTCRSSCCSWWRSPASRTRTRWRPGAAPPRGLPRTALEEAFKNRARFGLSLLQTADSWWLIGPVGCDVYPLSIALFHYPRTAWFTLIVSPRIE